MRLNRSFVLNPQKGKLTFKRPKGLEEGTQKRMKRIRMNVGTAVSTDMVTIPIRDESISNDLEAQALHHQGKVDAALFYNPEVDRKIWDVLPERGGLIMEIVIHGKGEKEGEEGEIPLAHRHWVSSLSGKKGLEQAARQWILEFHLGGTFDKRGHLTHSDDDMATQLRGVEIRVLMDAPVRGGTTTTKPKTKKLVRKQRQLSLSSQRRRQITQERDSQQKRKAKLMAANEGLDGPEFDELMAKANDDSMMKSTVRSLTNTIHVRDPPSKYKAYTGTPNVCFARALRYRTESIKHIMEPGWPRHYSDLLRKAGLPAGFKGGLTAPQALKMATAMKLGVIIHEYDPTRQAFHPHTYTNMKEGEPLPYEGYEFVLDPIRQHFYIYNFNLRPARVNKVSRARCNICDQDMPMEEIDGHTYAHEVAKQQLEMKRQERRMEYFTTSSWDRETETFEQFGARYAQDYVHKIWDYYMSQQIPDAPPEILWLAGPGGTGKSKALEAFEKFAIHEQGWDQSEILKLAHQGKAADNIGGKTIELYFHPLKQEASYTQDRVEALEKIKIIFIDEIGMVTASQLVRMTRKITHMLRNESIFGGIPVVFMGDLLQLPPVNKGHKTNKFDWFFQCALADYVTPVPMIEPMRFLQAGTVGLNFHDWLTSVRDGLWPSFEEFATLPFKFVTRSELLEEFEMSNRPMLLTHTNPEKHRFEEDVMTLEKANRKSELMDIPIRYYRVRPLSEEDSGKLYDWTTTEKDMLQLIRAVVGTDKVKDHLLENVAIKDLPKDLISKGMKGLATLKNGLASIEPDAPRLLQNLTELFYGQSLMVTQNYCGDPVAYDEVDDADDEAFSGLEVFKPQLFNGSVVSLKFVDPDERCIYVVDTKDNGEDEEFRIPAKYRFVNEGGFIYIVESYPVTTMIASTIHKVQGDSLDSLAYHVGRSDIYKTPHKFYVAMSRCRDPANIYFVIKDTTDKQWQDREIQQLRREKCYRALHEDHHPYVNDACVEAMRRTLKPDFSFPVDTVRDEDLSMESSYDDVRLFDRRDGKKWSFQAPKPFPGGDADELQLISDFHIIFDVETGAAAGFTDHPDFFDDDGLGDWKAFGNSGFLQQGWYLSGLFALKDGDVLWCKDYENLLQFERYQRKDGTILFHQGEFHEEDDSLHDASWCQRMTLAFILEVCEIKYRILDRYMRHKRKEDDDGDVVSGEFRGITNRQKAPVYLTGFNIDGFDIIGLQQQMMQSDTWIKRGYEVDITPNAGSSLTKFKLLKNFGRTRLPLLEMHDIQRVVGKSMSLDKTHAAYVKHYSKNKAEWHALADLSFKGLKAKEFALKGLEMGKGKFPHMLIQRAGVGPTLKDERVSLKLQDFVKRDQGLVDRQRKYLHMNLYKKLHEYMRGDLATTLACYVAFNKVVVDILHFSVMKLNTTQQLATYFFAGFTSTRSDIKVIHLLEHKDHRAIMYGSDLPLHNKTEYDFICSAIYGGRTLPRVRSWESTGDDDYYLQGDVSGMYAYAQEAYPYPYGDATFRANDPQLQADIKKLYNLAKVRQSPDMMAFLSEKSIVKGMFIAEVVLKYPSLCSEPNVPFRQDPKTDLPVSYNDGKCRLIHGIGVPDSKGKCHPRVQMLSNVHLANALADDADLVEVRSVLIWSKQGKILAPFMREVNKGKADASAAKNDGLKNFYKLVANSFYGACLKREQNTMQRFLTNMGVAEIMKLEKTLKKSNAYFNFAANGVVTVKGEKIDDPDTFCSTRSTGLGVFVLAWSQYGLGNVTRTAFGDNFNPTTRAQAREAILHPLLYGDTDSLYFHQSHVLRMVESDVHWRKKGRKEKLIFWNRNLDKDSDKTGRFLDEQAPDNVLSSKKPEDPGYEEPDYVEDFKNGVYVRVTKFASAAPKTYTHRAEKPTGEIKFKTKCKGVPLGRAELTLVDIPKDERRGRSYGSIHEREKMKEVQMTQLHVPPKFLGDEYRGALFRGSMDAKIEPEEEDNEEAERWLLREKHKQKKEMEIAHEMMYEAVRSDKLMLSTHTSQTLKKFGMQARTANVLRSDGSTEPSKQYTIGATNLDRCICKDGETLRWKGRRNLTHKEINFLFPDYTAEQKALVRRNHLVPIGYNYDGLLFKLP